MGLPEIIAKMIMEIGCYNGPMDTNEQKKKFIEVLNPEPSKGGFLRVQAVVACPCGTPIPVDASPPEMSEPEFDAAAVAVESDTNTELIKMKAKGCDDDSPTKIATNIGISQIKCPQCDVQYLVCWEFDACSISSKVPLPWDDQDGPDCSSSELDFSVATAPKGLVH